MWGCVAQAGPAKVAKDHAMLTRAWQENSFSSVVSKRWQSGKLLGFMPAALLMFWRRDSMRLAA